MLILIRNLSFHFLKRDSTKISYVNNKILKIANRQVVCLADYQEYNHVLNVLFLTTFTMGKRICKNYVVKSNMMLDKSL